MSNPWLPASAQAEAGPVTDEDLSPLTGPAAPQPGSAPPVDRTELLQELVPTETSGLWVIGAHGGAGETTVAELLGGTATQRRWPRVEPPAPVLLVARTHARGLRAAQLAMRAWAAGQTPPAELIGLLLVADAPRRAPKPLAQLASTLAGGVPRCWHLGWVPELRITTSVVNLQLSRRDRRPLDQIQSVVSNITKEN